MATSRTAEGKHTKRFIILVSSDDKNWYRSVNSGLSGHFPTRELAQDALDTPDRKTEGVTYKIRQK